jgi:hypothetical protein
MGDERAAARGSRFEERQPAVGKAWLCDSVIGCVGVNARPFRARRSERSPRAGQTGRAAGLIDQVLLLAALAGTTMGISAGAWVVGLTFLRRAAEGVRG